MTEQEILEFTRYGKLPGGEVCQGLKETHISWIVLGKEFVYKIKKPLQLSFLDFSSLEKRKFYCEQEVVLNQRLTHDIYLEVCPIHKSEGVYSMIPGPVDIIDYAVVMRRMDNNREMSTLLPDGKVSKTDIKKIAGQLVRFHKNAAVVKGKLTPEDLIEDFNDIRQVQPFILEHLGQQASDELTVIISFINDFINNRSELILNRDQQGFTRDCHGDLHSGNIFLLEEPVIFDCIEFNEHLRITDIFAELGFFCMDLEFYQCPHLSAYFMECYLAEFPVIRNESEEYLFLFYKLYRANVKAKINAIKAQQAHNQEELDSRLALLARYFKLLLAYYDILKNAPR